MGSIGFGAWLRACDQVCGLASEGRLTDDLQPLEYWFDSWVWGVEPERAAGGAVERLGLRLRSI